MTTTETQEFWENHYGERERVWSGRVNVRLAEVVESLVAGRALDLGCGEGADAIWLAERGWQVVAVDVSPTALRRAAEDAANLLDRIEFQRHDLSASFPDGSFDLVSAQFLHSPLEFDRGPLLRRGAQAVAPGGTLLIVDHANPPPGAKMGHDHHFPSSAEVIEELNLDSAVWQCIRADTVDREAVGPDGVTGVWGDNVIVLRRAS